MIGRYWYLEPELVEAASLAASTAAAAERSRGFGPINPPTASENQRYSCVWPWFMQRLCECLSWQLPVKQLPVHFNDRYLPSLGCTRSSEKNPENPEVISSGFSSCGQLCFCPHLTREVIQNWVFSHSNIMQSTAMFLEIAQQKKYGKRVPRKRCINLRKVVAPDGLRSDPINGPDARNEQPRKKLPLTAETGRDKEQSIVPIHQRAAKSQNYSFRLSFPSFDSGSMVLTRCQFEAVSRSESMAP